ncbi:hypothetical protein [Novosphingobium mangrovi (ex Hu et al. 2023)]|uniref:Lipoprotein n=2 Tax=Novosphingobium TaxID=165696 RepID=A0ABT0ADF6_9SPHN|nr:hypothetical protein [Novosphingobium mangrovi (ex Hu et al. 2023)]MCJ1961220.1 hypothetical protein [Novosphingobium mangrovi (ex Hu et al. 2023)]
MRTQFVIAAAVCSAALLLAGCESNAPEAIPSDGATGVGSELLVPEMLPSDAATGAVSGGIANDLDMEALTERRDPERLLRYYTSAIRLGDWIDAAKAWSLDAQMSPEKLRDEFGGKAGPKIAVGKGDIAGAAGSLYYEAPIVVDFADGRPSRRGTIVLRRVNDVPGASEEQLNWRIERTSTLTQ